MGNIVVIFRSITHKNGRYEPAALIYYIHMIYSRPAIFMNVSAFMYSSIRRAFSRSI